MPVTMARGNKFGALKKVVDGITFASSAEAQFYQHLRFLERAGEVLRFELQPAFELQKTFRKVDPTTGKVRTWRKRTYRADFRVWYADGRDLVIDVKGVKTEAFSLKQCLFEALYPDLHLVLATKKHGGWTYWQ